MDKVISVEEISSQWDHLVVIAQQRYVTEIPSGVLFNGAILVTSGECFRLELDSVYS